MNEDELTAHVRALLADLVPGRELLRISRPSAGIANRVLYLNTTHGELVLRVFDDRTGIWKPHKESAIFEHMRSIRIPAPRVCHVDTSRQLVPFMYSLSERVQGEPFSSVFPSLNETENASVYASLGDSLGRLHSTAFDQFGDVYGSADGLRVGPLHEFAVEGNGASLGPFATWSEMHAETVNARLRMMEGTEFEDLIPIVQTYVDRHVDQIACEIVARLLHMDLHRSNVLVLNGGVSAILDVEEAVVGHNEYDLMRTELANFRGQPSTYSQAFMQAYESHVSLDVDYSTRKEFYEVSRSLVWITSLVLYGDKYTRGSTDQSPQAARAHVLSLTGSH